MKKIAIVGSGISGLTCAHLLHEQYDISVFEAGNYIGGHTATQDILYRGKKWRLDTGFIVFNDRTYPNFEKLMAKIGMDRVATEMSFSVRNEDTGLEYSGSNLNALFAQRTNIFNLKFLKLIKEILRFNKLCQSAWEYKSLDDQISLGCFLDQQGFSEYFRSHYILPMGAAIWSASLHDMEAFPLYFFVRFFYNHGLLTINNRPQWYVVPNGSDSYVKPLIKGFENKVHLNAPVSKIFRENGQIKLKTEESDWQIFDEVILACHSDQAMSILKDLSQDEQDILGKMAYQKNEVVLHTDISMLPKKKLAWAAWNYHLNSDNKQPVAVTYNMNILQNLPADAPIFCVTLNHTQSIDANKILGRFNYSHPVFNQASIDAQKKRLAICGRNNTHFAGAYWYNGFHEDGVESALDVCRRFGVSL
ncbi:FAD-dependent oxidoreductase [Psychromonas sp. MB-3u-54]|uniref:NAD(P)/FAD-dependent oxidoreductase n=1 Tax=Psychromonas sp. MB-3u-54 TaxID=2058319 RepID=UPI000C3355DC|nr:FAD-dependent oxidoreductase [Psychromonas sp. MB-3u-54]PKH02920.1 FAD-dependent oxidoreductase [Psychromonas sp. MB-3u-54]